MCRIDSTVFLHRRHPPSVSLLRIYFRYVLVLITRSWIAKRKQCVSQRGTRLSYIIIILVISNIITLIITFIIINDNYNYSDLFKLRDIKTVNNMIKKCIDWKSVYFMLGNSDLHIYL